MTTMARADKYHAKRLVPTRTADGELAFRQQTVDLKQEESTNLAAEEILQRREQRKITYTESTRPMDF